jgi:hypothetical protein
MIMVATLAVGTMAVSYEYAFARPVAAHNPCLINPNVKSHNPNCGR